MEGRPDIKRGNVMINVILRVAASVGEEEWTPFFAEDSGRRRAEIMPATYMLLKAKRGRRNSRVFNTVDLKWGRGGVEST